MAVSLVAVGTLLPPIGIRSVSAQLDAEGLARRALSHLQTARANADPSYLTRAEAALDKAFDLDGPAPFEALLARASLSNARHDFSGSVEWAKRAIESNPYNASPYGVLGDALFELGRYRAGDRAYQRMIDIRPDVASYVRASYAYQLRGHTRAAVGAMRLALKAAGANREDTAWIRHQLGDVYFGAGRLRAAARQNRIGSRVAPDYIPPQVGLAEVHVARGRLDRAITTMERAVETLPTLEYTIALGDLYAATNRPRAARATYDAALDKIRDYYAHGVGPDVDFVLFFADRGVELTDTLAKARAIFEDRPTAPTADALAWTLHKLGRDAAAWPLARRASAARLRHDSAFDLHAGSVAEALGRDRAATAYYEAADARRLQLSPVQLLELRSRLAS